MVSKDDKQNVFEIAMIVMSGDMYQKIYDLSDYLGWIETANIIKDWAKEFTDKLIESGFFDDNCEIDFIFELEKFEDEKFEKLKRMYY